MPTTRFADSLDIINPFFGKRTAVNRKISRPVIVGLWLSIALASLVAAILCAPSRIVPSLPIPDDLLRAQITQGLSLVRIGLGVCTVLALVTAFFWRFDTKYEAAPVPFRMGTFDWAVVGGLAILVILSRAGHLSSSLWWDELATLLRSVRRGPLVIMSFAAGVSNHPLNSFLIWVSRALLGEREVALRLPAFLLGLAAPIACYLTMAKRLDRSTALSAAALFALHFTLAVHSTDARGYAGAILGSYLSCVFFALLLKQASLPVTILYIASSLMAIGFILTSILIPVAHGVLASVLWLKSFSTRSRPRERATSPNLVFCCSWVGVAAWVLIGLMIPQNLAQATGGAEKDYSHLDWPFVEELLQYLGGVHHSLLGAFLLFLSAAGWFQLKVDSRWRLAFLSPVLLGLIYLLLPSSRLAPRFFCFALPSILVGAGIYVGALSRRSIWFPGLILVIPAALWLTDSLSMHYRHLVVGNPDLRSLGVRLATRKVVLCGMQADVNRFYLPDAVVMHCHPETEEDLRRMREADYLVCGVHLRQGDIPDYHEYGFAVECVYEDWSEEWVETRVSFVVYKRFR
jgi:hypothetical protein